MTNGQSATVEEVKNVIADGIKSGLTVNQAKLLAIKMMPTIQKVTEPKVYAIRSAK